MTGKGQDPEQEEVTIIAKTEPGKEDAKRFIYKVFHGSTDLKKKKFI